MDYQKQDLALVPAKADQQFGVVRNDDGTISGTGAGSRLGFSDVPLDPSLTQLTVYAAAIAGGSAEIELWQDN